MTLFKWSRTAANNANADSTCPFPEGMAASAVNDGTRGMMAATAKFRDDIAGAIVTGGTLTAYTVASFQGFDTLANLNGKAIAFSPHATNGDTVTLNVDGLGAKPLRSAPGVELLAGTLILGSPYAALYNSSDAVFYLQGYFASPYSIPFLGGVDYWDTVTPGSGFIFPAGQAISRTVYSRAFARWGTTFGVGNGTTTFNVPDKTGRVSAMMEAAAARLTGTFFGGNSATLGAVGGAEKETLLTANLPPYTPAGAIGGNTGEFNISQFNVGGVGVNLMRPGTGSTLPLAGTATFTGTPQGGTSAPVVTVQPTIVCNYIIRII